MIDDPKEEKKNLTRLIRAAEKKGLDSRFRSARRHTDLQQLIRMIGHAHQLILGLLAISISLLGMLQSTGLMLTLFVLGSLSAVSGVYSLYRLYTTSRIFDSLVNRAIRRAIESQN